MIKQQPERCVVVAENHDSAKRLIHEFAEEYFPKGSVVANFGQNKLLVGNRNIELVFVANDRRDLNIRSRGLECQAFCFIDTPPSYEAVETLAVRIRKPSASLITFVIDQYKDEHEVWGEYPDKKERDKQNAKNCFLSGVSAMRVNKNAEIDFEEMPNLPHSSVSPFKS